MSYKKFLAAGLAATMVMGSSVVAFADDGSTTGETTATGGLEGTVTTDVFNVVLPVNNLTFTIDPEGLIAATNAARYDGAEFETGATVLFENTVATDDGTDSKYTSTSDTLTVTNKSSGYVDVTVVAVITGADGVTLTADSTFADDTSTSLYMAIVDAENPDGVAITSEGATVEGNIAPAPKGAYEYNWDGNAYTYTLVDNDANFKTYELNLTGASNAAGDWSELTEIAPVVTLTWTVALGNAPAVDVTVTGDTATVEWDGESDLKIAVDTSVVADMSEADFGIIYMNKIYTYTGNYNGDTTLESASLASLEGNTIILHSAIADYLSDGDTLYIIGSEKVTVATVTVNYTE